MAVKKAAIDSNRVFILEIGREDKGSLTEDRGNIVSVLYRRVFFNVFNRSIEIKRYNILLLIVLVTGAIIIVPSIFIVK